MSVPKRFLRIVFRVLPLVALVCVAIVYLLPSAKTNEPITIINKGLESAKSYIEKGLGEDTPFYSGTKAVSHHTDQRHTDGSGPRLKIDQIKSLLHFPDDTSLDAASVIKNNYAELYEIMNTPITEPKVNNLVRPPKNPDEYQRANGTLMILARNRDMRAVTKTIKQIEQHFNSKYHYPYVFLNDSPFSNTFKKRVSGAASGETYFEQIDEKDWKQPDYIDSDKQHKGVKELVAQNVAYARKVSYHNMCRYYSKGFYNHPRMKQFKYYWRFEPGTDYYCDIDYDVFKFMEDNNKTYGFVISLYDIEHSLHTLWPTTLKFVEKHPEYVNPNAAFSFLTEDVQNPQKARIANGYSTCHFWSNFEIANMDFYRSTPYSSWVDYLDHSGGFYYERWGDAPVHSVGVGLFEDKEKVHWFRDIGYSHHPYTNCPNSDKCSGCTPGKFTFDHLQSEQCLTTWWDYEMSDQERKLY